MRSALGRTPHPDLSPGQRFDQPNPGMIEPTPRLLYPG